MSRGLDAALQQGSNGLHAVGMVDGD